MKVIDVKEAKARFEDYARECQSSPVVVTVRDTPVFEMLPIRHDGYHGCHAHGFAWAWEDDGYHGCHAHGFAWAWEDRGCQFQFARPSTLW